MYPYTEYKDWWVPKVEVVTVDKDRAKKQAAPSSAPTATTDEVSGLSAYRFLSLCQWSGPVSWRPTTVK